MAATPARVVTLLVIPTATTATLLAWAAIDSAFYAYRLWRDLRQLTIIINLKEVTPCA